MKLADIEIGGRYIARVSGRLVVVVVLRRAETSRFRPVTRFVCRNQQTGREITCTAARLRRRVLVSGGEQAVVDSVALRVAQEQGD